MRVLFNHPDPFVLAHGGVQIQIEQTKAALERVGVEVEFLRWWDDSQRGDIIHFFGRPAAARPDLIRQKGLKLVVTHLLGGLGVRPAWKRFLQKMTIWTALRMLPSGPLARTGWSAWKMADAYIAVTSWEAKLMREVFQAPANHVHVVPNGVSDCFFEDSAETRIPWLVTAASILPVKRVVETAEAAIVARTPYWVIGRPFSESDAYYQQFLALCHQHPEALRYEKIMRTQLELAQIYRQARGFVLLSRWESQSLSALEAAACECPLLLGDLPWARATFGERASYCSITSPERTAKYLRKFYDEAPTLQLPPKPLRWIEIAQKLKSIYEQVLKESPVLLQKPSS
jgi:glycosyltransferase involved in cell wall biosynthesis